MSKTLSLNSTDTIMITTFWGGKNGRSYTIHLFMGDKEMITTLTEDEFFEMVLNYNDDIQILASNIKPVAENQQVPAIDPMLQALLDEEEQMEKNQPRPVVYVRDLLFHDHGRKINTNGDVGLLVFRDGEFLMQRPSGYTYRLEDPRIITFLD